MQPAVDVGSEAWREGNVKESLGVRNEGNTVKFGMWGNIECF